MKKGFRGLIAAMAVVAVTSGKSFAQDDKPIGPGWLSLDSSVGVIDNSIANGKGALEKALGISIGGYLDTGWTFSTNHPSNPSYIGLRYFDRDQNKIVFNNFHLVVDKPEKDWGVGFHISGDFGRTGEFLREATFYGVNKFRPGGTNGGEASAELRESYLTTTIPVGEGLQIKGGLWVTTLGTEILLNPGQYNDTISRSFLFNLAIPFRHLGVMLSYPVHKMVSVNAGVVTGWDDPHDRNNQPSGMWGISFTPMDQLSLVSSFILGPEQRHNNANKRFTMTHVATIKPMDPLTILLEYVYGHEGKASLSGLSNATWQGLAAVAAYDWTDRFKTALRGEWFNDRNGARIGGDAVTGQSNVAVGELTLSGSYRFTKMLTGRTEIRQDWSNGKVFAVGDGNRATNIADKSQTTFGLQLLYQF